MNPSKEPKYVKRFSVSVALKLDGGEIRKKKKSRKISIEGGQ